MKIVDKKSQKTIAIIDENEVLLLDTKEYKIVNDEHTERERNNEN